MSSKWTECPSAWLVAAVAASLLLGVPGARAANPTSGTNPAARASAVRVAVVPLNFSDLATQPFTPEQAREWTFTGDRSVASFYRAVSYGSFALGGDVLGWQTLGRARGKGCAYWEWMAQADEQLGAALDGYDKVVYAAPNVPECELDGAVDTVGGARAFVNGLTTDGRWLEVVGHELGHLLGADHAQGVVCSESGATVALSPSCERRPYADPFDVMGRANNRHPNANHLAAMGLLPAAATVTIASSGVYSIGPLETTGADPRLVRIPYDRDPDGNTRYLLLEYRQPSQFDDFSDDDPAVNGVLVRFGLDPERHAQTDLIDATPETPGDFTDAPLLAGKSLTDDARGLSITVLSVGPAGADVRIDYGGFIVNDATCGPVDMPATVAPNQSVDVAIELTNTGGTTWSAAAGHRVVPLDGSGELTLADGAEVPPGQPGVFRGAITPWEPFGARDFRWRPYQGAMAFGETCTNPVTVVEDARPPSNPSGLGARQISQSAVEVSWTAATDDVGVRGYRLYRSTDGAGRTLVGDISGTTATDTGLSVGRRYSYAVVAYDRSGNESPESAPVEVELADITAPGAPSGLTAMSRTAESVSLRWAPAADNVGVTSYQVFRFGLDSLTYVLVGSTSEQRFVDEGLGLVAYGYYVVAVDGAGNTSAPSATVLALTCLPLGVCPVPAA